MQQHGRTISQTMQRAVLVAASLVLVAGPAQGHVTQRVGHTWNHLRPRALALVTWGNLQGLPAGFADGVDNEGWSLTGNPGGTGQFIGTTERSPLDFRMMNRRVLRFATGFSEQFPGAAFVSAPSLVAGGSANDAGGGGAPFLHGATIGGGGAHDANFANYASGEWGTIGGGAKNKVGGHASDYFATVGGGYNNWAKHYFSTIPGGTDNIASFYAFAVGENNEAAAAWSSIAGGKDHVASGGAAFIGGGIANNATGQQATVGGGENGVASGDWSTVSGGVDNQATADGAAVGGGGSNVASGFDATVPGGQFNTAAGKYSFAAGRRGKALFDGTFVWADSQNADIAPTGANQFVARANGRFFLQSDSTLDDQGGYLNTSTGAHLTTGGTWTNASSRDLKADFAPVDAQSILAAVADLPITTWRYRNEAADVRHIGPVSQDFHAAFGVGGDERAISTVDADGIALAAIKGLNEKVEAQQSEIARLSSAAERSGGGLTAEPFVLIAATSALGVGLGFGLGRGIGRARTRRRSIEEGRNE